MASSKRLSTADTKVSPTATATPASKSKATIIAGVTKHIQSNPKWSGEQYKFATNFFYNPYSDPKYTIGKVGCTMSSLANAISGATGKDVTPSELNKKATTSSFQEVYKVKAETLSGGLLKPAGKRIEITTDAKDNITGDSNTGVLNKIKESIKNGKPVVIGLTSADGKSKTADGYDRHTVVGYGVSESDKILVRDPAGRTSKDGKTASSKTLDETMKYWGETHIDFATAISKEPEAKRQAGEPNPQPGPSPSASTSAYQD